MTDRLMTLAAALLLAVTLSACGETDSVTTAPDTTPNGSITAQPDTSGSDTDAGTGSSAARSRDRALAASLSQLILNRLPE